MSSKKKSIILLSGGLDSVVSLAILKKEQDIKLALTFDYGQKASKQEIEASKKIANYYNVEHKVIELPWLKAITQTALVNNSKQIPKIGIENLKNSEITVNSAKNVWIPNRNALFLNIAACFADSYDFSFIILGANKEEAATFSDNTKDFVEKASELMIFSTQKQPQVIAPLIDYCKKEIVELAIKHNVPLEVIRSCYSDSKIIADFVSLV